MLFCRNPIPDHYSISLEVSKDRTTQAQMISCDNPGSSCPSFRLATGDKYLSRSVNEPCNKMVRTVKNSL